MMFLRTLFVALALTGSLFAQTKSVAINPSTGNLSGPIPTFAKEGKLVYVDSVFGSDSTGTRARGDLRFATITAALAAAQSGDLVVVKPGTYDEKNILRNGIDVWLEGTVTYTGNTASIIDDTAAGTNSDIVASIRGPGSIITTGRRSPIHMVRAGSRVSVDLATISADNTDAAVGYAAIYQIGGELRVRAHKISAKGYGIYWEAGPCYIDALTIETTTSSGTFPVWCHAIAGDHLHITTQFITSSISTAIFCDGNSNARVWINAQRIISNGGSAIVASGPVVYVTAQKLQSAGTTDVPLIEVDSGTLYLDASKCEGGDLINQTGMITLYGGASFIRIGETVDTGLAASPLATCSGGTHHIDVGNMVRTTSGDGIQMDGGTLYARGRINTAVNASYSPIRKSGGTLVLGTGSVLVAHSSASSIAGSAQSVKVMPGCAANKAVAAGITQQISPLTVDTLVQ